MRTWLLDTGPLVAYLDDSDPAHSEVINCLDGYSGLLATTSAVVTETMYFASEVKNGPRLVVEILSGGRVQIFDLTQGADLRQCVELMEKYSDTPMDFADATLVLLADRIGSKEVLTLDRRGFSTFRPRGKSAFHLVLDFENFS